MTEQLNEKNVYWCINEVQKELAEIGISKDKTANTGNSGSYKFRGIDDIYNALSSILAKHGLCILPNYSNKQVIERTSAKGNALFYTTIDGKFDFVSKFDGSKHPVTTLGEAMDSGDKGTNKAMSAAYKYACLQAFCIPTEGETIDSESDTHMVKPQEPKLSAAEKKQKYQNYMDCLERAITKELWAQVKPSKDNWVLWALNNFGEDYADQLNDKFLALAMKFEASGMAPQKNTLTESEKHLGDEMPDFLK